MILSWLFRKFWSEAPNNSTETAWNCVQEDDAWEGVRYQLERIANVLERMERLQ